MEVDELISAADMSLLAGAIVRVCGDSDKEKQE
jgi:hypothetical protein